MSEIENMNERETETEQQEQNEEVKKLSEELAHINENIAYLRDLFVRRLNDDKQKNNLIQQLSNGASFAFIEPFLSDIILLLDRLEKSEDDFVESVREELYGIISRRGVERIQVGTDFNPNLYKAVKINEVPGREGLQVSGIIRNGYTFSGKVIRPAEVIIERGI